MFLILVASKFLLTFLLKALQNRDFSAPAPRSIRFWELIFLCATQGGFGSWPVRGYFLQFLVIALLSLGLSLLMPLGNGQFLAVFHFAFVSRSYPFILLSFPFIFLHFPFVSFHCFLAFLPFSLHFLSFSFRFLSFLFHFSFTSFHFLQLSFHFPFMSFPFPCVSFYLLSCSFHVLDFFPFVSFNLLSCSFHFLWFCPFFPFIFRRLKEKEPGHYIL